MGCGGSKEEEKKEEKEEPDEKLENEKNDKDIESTGGKPDDIYNPNTKAGFRKVVIDTLRMNATESLLIHRMEALISANCRSRLDAFNRRQIIKKVIGKEFVKGCIVVRSANGVCCF